MIMFLWQEYIKGVQCELQDLQDGELEKWRSVTKKRLNWDLQDFEILDDHVSVAGIHQGCSV